MMSGVRTLFDFGVGIRRDPPPTILQHVHVATPALLYYILTILNIDIICTLIPRMYLDRCGFSFRCVFLLSRLVTVFFSGYVLGIHYNIIL